MQEELTLPEELTLNEQRWLLEQYKRLAHHHVPRRPFPAQDLPGKPVAWPIEVVPLTPVPVHKAFPSFWAWAGHFSLVWFLIELPPAIGHAWKQARLHRHALFLGKDGWTI